MLDTAPFDLSGLILPAAALVVVAVVILGFFLYQRLSGSAPRPGERERQQNRERGQELRAAAEKVCARCGEARAAAGPLLSTDYSAGEQMNRILEELAKASELQEQMAGAVRELSEGSGEQG